MIPRHRITHALSGAGRIESIPWGELRCPTIPDLDPSLLRRIAGEGLDRPLRVTRDRKGYTVKFDREHWAAIDLLREIDYPVYDQATGRVLPATLLYAHVICRVVD